MTIARNKEAQQDDREYKCNKYDVYNNRTKQCIKKGCVGKQCQGKTR